MRHGLTPDDQALADAVLDGRVADATVTELWRGISADARRLSRSDLVLRKLLEREARHLRVFEGQRVRKMDLVTACGEDDVRLLLDAAGGRGRVECLPNGVDLDAFAEDGPAAASGHVVL